MTNSIAELEDAECIFITGSNTSENHPIIAVAIRQAVREKGAALIVADPRRIGMVDFAQVWLQEKREGAIFIDSTSSSSFSTGNNTKSGQRPNLK